ncbi:hypothetical protein [Mesobacillus zeae]|uniref:hypothetical protein n=1 Tax=Mesobacillus zeae TaxID=1917180 RepID=UPI003008034E
MFLRKQRLGYWSGLVLFILLLSGCNSNEKSVIDHYYLSLSGESENWEVKSYKLELSPDVFNVGNGTITMKNQTMYTTDFIDIKVHAIINNENEVIQSKKIIGDNTEINKMTIGAIEGKVEFVDKNGIPITLENISDIYIEIEWQAVNEKQRMQEKIDIYNKETFFNVG